MLVDVLLYLYEKSSGQTAPKVCSTNQKQHFKNCFCVAVYEAICFNFLCPTESSALDGNFPRSSCFYGCHRGSG